MASSGARPANFTPYRIVVIVRVIVRKTTTAEPRGMWSSALRGRKATAAPCFLRHAHFLAECNKSLKALSGPETRRVDSNS